MIEATGAPLSPPRLRGRFPWPAIVIALLLAGATRTPVALIIAGGGIVAWIITEVTARLALLGLDVELEVSPRRVLAGETVIATLVLTNRKPIHLPWLEVRIALPEGIVAQEDESAIPRMAVDAVLAPRGHERIRMHFPLRVNKRGPYTIGPVQLRSSDWLGFVQDQRTAETYYEIVAHPRAIGLEDRHRAAFRPLAESAVRRGLVPDPLRFRGVREHQRGDPRKEIHWKATARLRRLQTKLYEPAASLDAMFLLNVASHAQYWVIADPDAVETVISATSELVRMAADAGRQVGLVTNGLDELTHQRPRAPLGRGPRPVTRCLDMLARLGPYASTYPETVFLRERGRMPWGATLIIVTPLITEGLASAALALRRTQHRVLVVSVQHPPAAIVDQLASADIQVDTVARRSRRAAA